MLRFRSFSGKGYPYIRSGTYAVRTAVFSLMTNRIKYFRMSVPTVKTLDEKAGLVRLEENSLLG